MRTIYPNAKAVGAIVLVVVIVAFLLISIYQINFHLSSTEKSSMKEVVGQVMVPRDVVARRQMEQQGGPKKIEVPVDVGHEQKKVQEEKKEKNGGGVKRDGGEVVEPAVVEPNAPGGIKIPPPAPNKNQAKDNKQEVKSADEDTKQKDKSIVLPEKDDRLEDAKRREVVVEMISHTWHGYKNYSWGANELMPVAKKPHSQAIFGGAQMMATIVDGADTLWLAGLKDEYNEARDYIRDNFDISKASGTFSVFEVTIRHIGGFLSLYALTKEKFYLEKAKSVADQLLLAFDTPSGIPKSLVSPSSKSVSNYGWAMGGASILAEIGSLHLEFSYLSEMTGDPVYRNKVQKVRDVLDAAHKPNGLYPNYLSPDTGNFVGDHISLGAMGDSFYEILLKSWIKAKSDKQAYKMYKEASEAIRKHMVFKSKGGLTYLGELRNGGAEHKMGHLACFTPGMFALEAECETDPVKKKEIMELAEGLGNTCHESYIRSTSGIGPEMFAFEEGFEAKTRSETGYILRPEVVEGFFYLWRLTGNKKYKEWVWDAVQAFNKYCRVEGGFAGLRNVYSPEQGYDDVQQSFWLAETLKYAFLTFSDEQLPLKEWVFNTEAHLFPVDSSASDLK